MTAWITYTCRVPAATPMLTDLVSDRPGSQRLGTSTARDCYRWRLQLSGEWDLHTSRTFFYGNIHILGLGEDVNLDTANNSIFFRPRTVTIRNKLTKYNLNDCKNPKKEGYKLAKRGNTIVFLTLAALFKLHPAGAFRPR